MLLPVYMELLFHIRWCHDNSFTVSLNIVTFGPSDAIIRFNANNSFLMRGLKIENSVGE